MKAKCPEDFDVKAKLFIGPKFFHTLKYLFILRNREQEQGAEEEKGIEKWEKRLRGQKTENGGHRSRRQVQWTGT